MLRNSYVFDPIGNRESYLTMDRYLIRTMTDMRFNSRKPMGEIARNRLQDALRCWLAGLDDAIASALPRYCNWLAQAIENDEAYGERHHFHRMNLHSAHAMARWMLHAEPGVDKWRAALRSELDDWHSPASPWDVGAIVERRLEDFLLFCIQAREFAAGIEEVECRIVKRRIRLDATIKPREFAYAVCQHHMRGDFGVRELFEAGRRMLQANLAESWLNRGHALKAAMWLKVVYWDRELLGERNPLLTPLQTVLRAYRNMPRVPTPTFVRLEAE